MRGSSLRISFISIWASSSFSRAMMSTASASTTNNTRKPAVAAIAQLRSTSNKFQNLLDIATCARMAKDLGASMLFLPECFGFMGESSVQTLEQAEDPVLEDRNSNDDRVTAQLISTVSGKTNGNSEIERPDRVYLLDGLRTIARESGLWLSGGGMHVSGAPPDPASGNQRVYNTHVILDHQGEVKATYRKVHLFDVSIPGKVELRESATTAPGTELVVCDSPIGKLGLTTCYDVRFPEMYAPLVKNGAQILLVPSAFTVPTGAAHWHTLLQARAIENQCYVLAAAQFGQHNEKRQSFGHSLAVDPWGEILCDAGGYPYDGLDDSAKAAVSEERTKDPPTVVTCTIDLEAIDSIRQRMPLEQHRKSATFSFLE